MQETKVWSLAGSGKSSGGGNGNPLQYSCLKNPMDRGPWRAAVHKVTKELGTTEWAENWDCASQNPHWGWELMTSRDPAPFPAPATSIAFLTSAWNLFQLTHGSFKMTGLLVQLPWHPTLALSSTFSEAHSRPFCTSVILECCSVYESAPDCKARACVPLHFPSLYSAEGPFKDKM